MGNITRQLERWAAQYAAMVDAEIPYVAECALYLSTAISGSLSDGVSCPVVLWWLFLPVTLEM